MRNKKANKLESFICLDHFMSQQGLEPTRGKKHLRSRDINERGVDKESTSWRTFLLSH